MSQAALPAPLPSFAGRAMMLTMLPTARNDRDDLRRGDLGPNLRLPGRPAAFEITCEPAPEPGNP